MKSYFFQKGGPSNRLALRVHRLRFHLFIGPSNRERSPRHEGGTADRAAPGRTGAGCRNASCQRTGTSTGHGDGDGDLGHHYCTGGECRRAIVPGCQWRSKKGPPWRCKKGPLGGCGLVPVVHGRAPGATRRALNRPTRRRAREGPVGPRGQAWAGWSVQLAVGV